MPRHKDLKRLVRGRMQKTGESYTTARAQVTRKGIPIPIPKPSPIPIPIPIPSYADLAGMSDEKVKAATGCTWDRWVMALDHYGAAAMPHRDIAKLIQAKYKTSDWWAQSVTVGYERIKGLREKGQRRSGYYEANKSRTYNVPVTELFAAWHDAPARRRWLQQKGVRMRSATAPKSMRLDFGDGTTVVVGFTAKGAAKSSVAVQHEKLPDKDTAERMKQFWAERLGALAAQLQ